MMQKFVVRCADAEADLSISEMGLGVSGIEGGFSGIRDEKRGRR